MNQLIKVLPSIQFKNQSEKFTEVFDPNKLLPGIIARIILKTQLNYLYKAYNFQLIEHTGLILVH